MVVTCGWTNYSYRIDHIIKISMCTNSVTFRGKLHNTIIPVQYSNILIFKLIAHKIICPAKDLSAFNY